MNHDRLKFRAEIFLLSLLAIPFLFSCSKDSRLPVEKFSGCDDSSYFYKDGGGALGTIIILPNAFTPNADGLNDIFKPVYQNLSDYSMTVKDSKGIILFTTSDPNMGWNGKDKSGVATEDYYEVTVRFKDTKGNSESRSINIALYQYHNGCLSKEANSGCRFGDQIDLNEGFIYPTEEKICP